MPISRVLVTGGAGFIGSNFVRHVLATTNWHVTILDAFTYAAVDGTLDDIEGPRVGVITGSIADEALMKRLCGEHDVIVNFAAETHNDHSIAAPAAFIDTNVVGTFRLLEAVRATGIRLHHVSTDEVYGDLASDDAERFTEDTPYRPSSPYSASKASSDHLVRAWVRTYGITATISNCSNNYGPYQHIEKLIPRQITQLIDGQRPRVYGNGTHIRDWIHVDDHSSAVVRILQAGRVGETYLIGAENERTNLEVVQTLLGAFELPDDHLDFVADRPGHDTRYAIDPSKIRRELGWRPSKDFASGIAETIDWYRSNESWWRPLKAATEAVFDRRGL